MAQKVLGFYPRPEVNFPNDQQRLVIVGTTGSGKTHAALWHLARRNYEEKPWIIYDWKWDEFINSLSGTFELDVASPAPEKPGLYIVHPVPEDDDEAVRLQMIDIWKKEDIGVFVDEGYMVSTKNDGFRKLLTQGRSKHIPMIIGTQRPVWMDKFVFTESEFKQVFRLQSDDDLKKMREYIKQIDRIAQRYPLEEPEFKRWSYYYDGTENNLVPLRPVPDQNTIRSMFNAKLARLKEVI